MKILAQPLAAPAHRLTVPAPVGPRGPAFQALLSPSRADGTLAPATPEGFQALGMFGRHAAVETPGLASESRKTSASSPASSSPPSEPVARTAAMAPDDRGLWHAASTPQGAPLDTVEAANAMAPRPADATLQAPVSQPAAEPAEPFQTTPATQTATAAAAPGRGWTAPRPPPAPAGPRLTVAVEGTSAALVVVGDDAAAPAVRRALRARLSAALAEHGLVLGDLTLNGQSAPPAFTALIGAPHGDRRR